MDTMKLLLGATVALLLGALAVSWQGMNQGVKQTSAGELDRKLEKERQQLRIEFPQPANAEVEAMKLQVAESKLALESLEREKDASREKKISDQEELLGDQRNLENKDSELRRARLISNALLVGRVKEYVDAELGGFVTLDVLMPEQVQSGTILAIRRKTGILGQLKVSDVTAEGAIANPMPGFGQAQPQSGDELILPPPY